MQAGAKENQITINDVGRSTAWCEAWLGAMKEAIKVGITIYEKRTLRLQFEHIACRGPLLICVLIHQSLVSTILTDLVQSHIKLINSLSGDGGLAEHDMHITSIDGVWV